MEGCRVEGDFLSLGIGRRAGLDDRLLIIFLPQLLGLFSDGCAQGKRLGERQTSEVGVCLAAAIRPGSVLLLSSPRIIMRQWCMGGRRGEMTACLCLLLPPASIIASPYSLSRGPSLRTAPLASCPDLAFPQGLVSFVSSAVFPRALWRKLFSCTDGGRRKISRWPPPRPPPSMKLPRWPSIRPKNVLPCSNSCRSTSATTNQSPGQ